MFFNSLIHLSFYHLFAHIDEGVKHKKVSVTSYYGYRRYFLMLIDMDRRKMLL